MDETDIAKKRPSGRSSDKIRGARDWHPADVKAAVEKAGWSLRRLSRHHGYASAWFKHAFRKPSPTAEGIIAAAIGMHPSAIWPSRYDAAGNPKTPIKRGRVVPDNIPPRDFRHGPNRKAA